MGGGELVAGGSHLAQSEAIAEEVRVMLARAGVVEEELARIIRREEGPREISERERQELHRIMEYKKRLVQLLSSLRRREQNMSEMASNYRRMH